MKFFNMYVHDIVQVDFYCLKIFNKTTRNIVIYFIIILVIGLNNINFFILLL
jgi:hypothetical protein